MIVTAQIKVRDAKQQDVNHIYTALQILADYEGLTDRFIADPNHLQQYLFADKPKAMALVAEVEDNFAGVLVYSLTHRNFMVFKNPGTYIHDLFVHSEFRNKGVGKALIGKILLVAKENNYSRIDGLVMMHNQYAKLFYHRLSLLPGKRQCDSNHIS